MIEPTGPYTYHLQLGGAEAPRHIKAKRQNGQAIRFQGPVSAKKRPKIYLIRHKGEVVYVGYADQPIGSPACKRLQRSQLLVENKYPLVS